MKTTIIGYPRIGNLRELKFASEQYFRGEITAAELEAASKEIRLLNLNLQKDSGLDLIPSNDFSFYDGVLDTAFLLNAVPGRYTALGLSPLDTYFAAARGYQGEKGDVKALAMKKWYNTNYHYMVPEISDDTEISLSGTKPFDLFGEALENGIRTKPVILGAYTFLKLARYTGTKTAAEFMEQTAAAYSAILRQFGKLGAEWVQFDEPSLVKDMTAEDIALFKRIACGNSADMRAVIAAGIGYAAVWVVTRIINDKRQLAADICTVRIGIGIQDAAADDRCNFLATDSRMNAAGQRRKHRMRYIQFRVNDSDDLSFAAAAGLFIKCRKAAECCGTSIASAFVTLTTSGIARTCPIRFSGSSQLNPL